MIRTPILAALIVIGATEKGCQKQMPIWKGKIYVGNYIEGTVERLQEGEIISTQDPQFGEFICIRKESYKCFVDTYIVASKGWEYQSECGLQEEGSQRNLGPNSTGLRRALQD